jgi:outer membrane murein-binding lipoprotein Lpp
VPKPNFHQFSFNALLKAEGDGRKFSGLAYSGGYIPQLMGVIDLESTKVADSMPLLLLHNDEKVIGVVEDYTLNGKLTVNGEIHSDIDEDAASVVAKAKRGNRYQMSVGVFNANEYYVKAGEKVTVNGRDFTGPMVVLKNGFIREVSVVPLGADAETEAQFFSQSKSGAPAMKTAEQLAADVETLTAQVTKLTADNAQLTADLKAANDKVSLSEAAAKKAADDARTAEVKAIFKAIGQEIKDDEVKPYLDMSADQFKAVTVHLKAAKPNLPAHLFKHTATNGKDAEGDKAAGGSVLLKLAKEKHGLTT